jgi:hypothetical protein
MGSDVYFSIVFSNFIVVQYKRTTTISYCHWYSLNVNLRRYHITAKFKFESTNNEEDFKTTDLSIN